MNTRDREWKRVSIGFDEEERASLFGIIWGSPKMGIIFCGSLLNYDACFDRRRSSCFGLCLFIRLSEWKHGSNLCQLSGDASVTFRGLISSAFSICLKYTKIGWFLKWTEAALGSNLKPIRFSKEHVDYFDLFILYIRAGFEHGCCYEWADEECLLLVK